MSLNIDAVFPHPPESILNHLQNPRLKTMWQYMGFPTPPVLGDVYNAECLLIDKAFDKIIIGAFLTLLAPANINVSPTGVNWNFTLDKPSELGLGNVIYPFGRDPQLGLGVDGPMWAFVYGNLAGSEVVPAHNIAVPAYQSQVPAHNIAVPAGPAPYNEVEDAYNIANVAHNDAEAAYTTVKNMNRIGSYKAQLCEVLTKNRTIFLNATFQAAFISANAFALACAFVYWTGTWV